MALGCSGHSWEGACAAVRSVRTGLPASGPFGHKDLLLCLPLRPVWVQPFVQAGTSASESVFVSGVRKGGGAVPVPADVRLSQPGLFPRPLFVPLNCLRTVVANQLTVSTCIVVLASAPRVRGPCSRQDHPSSRGAVWRVCGPGRAGPAPLLLVLKGVLGIPCPWNLPTDSETGLSVSAKERKCSRRFAGAAPTLGLSRGAAAIPAQRASWTLTLGVLPGVLTSASAFRRRLHVPEHACALVLLRLRVR